jgi:hypothetical protein
MNELIKAKANELYPVKKYANEYTAFIQGAKYAMTMIGKGLRTK